jgi:DNA modification methylase
VILRGNALTLPLADDTVDLVVTSPPYFGLRSYQDGGAHYAGQIGDEATPAEFVDALVAATAEMVRVVKPSGSIFVNLGDKYSQRPGQYPNGSAGAGEGLVGGARSEKHITARRGVAYTDMQPKCLMLIPQRYAIRCVDELGLILRAEIIWSKPNGLPESVTDRVRRSHESWFHFTLSPRYYSAVDEIREPQNPVNLAHHAKYRGRYQGTNPDRGDNGTGNFEMNPLGKLPSSVWTIPTEPLHVPDHLGVDHFAAYPTEWPRRIIQGWSPSGICTACGEGRRPVTAKAATGRGRNDAGDGGRGDRLPDHNDINRYGWAEGVTRVITGEECSCSPHMASTISTMTAGATARPVDSSRTTGERNTLPPTRPALVLDPFGGTGTTALVAQALGRHAIHVDMSADYCRLATWRTTDPKQRAKAARREYTPPPEQTTGQLDLLEGLGA